MTVYPPQRPKFCRSEEVLVLISAPHIFNTYEPRWFRDFIIGVQWVSDGVDVKGRSYTGWLYKRAGGSRGVLHKEKDLQKIPEDQRLNWKTHGNVWRPADLDMSC